ncbi:PREDICTED: uncharacterized protein LOC104823621 [Tarenaya hassleriana]|uniref:uncharacterized protein LOC104823621 n=1 Tax=Tarenaya hassleriana TaxID=28532 RepID=UPI00053C2E9B|nr:PREDICTED: uncharacterized protein LOC104823621 [Tarenaya hassleriana]
MWFSGLRKLLGPTASGNDHGGSLLVRYMSRKRAVNVRKINPKVPIQEAYAISDSLYHLIKQHGPLSVPNTWIRAQEAGISGLNSKTHMKLILKWMRGRNMLKLICNHVGSSKKFAHCTLPEDNPQTNQTVTDEDDKIKKKPSSKRKQRAK